MGRQKKFNEDSKVLTIRVPKSRFDDIKEIVKKMIHDENFSLFYSDNTMDTQILRKMIIPFAQNKVKVDLDIIESKRIKILWEMIQKNA